MHSYQLGVPVTRVPFPMALTMLNFTVSDLGTSNVASQAPAFACYNQSLVTTMAPTTTIAPTTAVPTTTVSPTPTPTTTADPTTTDFPTTTTVPPTSTTTAPTPTTSNNPTTTATPTTQPPTQSLPPTPTTTAAPTNPPVTIVTTGTLTTKVESGDVTQVPPPVTNTSLVLVSNANVTITLPITLSSNASVLVQKADTLVSSTVTFNVTNLPKPVQIAVILSDVDGTQAGNVTVTVTSASVVTVDLKDLLSSIRQIYQQDFTIRAIRGSILKVSLGIITQDVPVNIDETVSTTIIVATPATSVPSPSSTSASVTTTTVTPLSTKPSISMAASLILNVGLICALVAIGM